jgi:hypothetical protein
VPVQIWLLFLVGVVAILLTLAGAVAVTFWLLSQWRRMMERLDKEHRRAEQHLDQADELQRRSLELLNRAEAFFARVESLVARLENK